MEWSNEKAINFLEILQTEPCLWDPRLKSFKNRRLQNDAWRRIMESLPFKTTIEHMKKKKESLMGYYRTHLHKIKKSQLMYSTNWFAFDTMDSFLREVYESGPTINTLTNEEDSEVQDGSEGKKYGNENSHFSSEIENVSQNIHEENRARPGEIKSSGDRGRKRLRDDLPTEMREAECQMDEASEYTKEKEDDECEIFGRLITCKLQKIRNPITRDILMNDIHNLIFRTCMADRREQRFAIPQLSAFQSSRHQNPPLDQFTGRSSQENFPELPAARPSPIVTTDSQKLKIEE